MDAQCDQLLGDMNMQHWHTEWAFKMDMHDGLAAWTSSKDIQHEHAA
jgi:hypothetical protein